MQEDISSQVGEFIPVVKSGIVKQKDLLSEYSEPHIPVGDHCKKPFECPFNEYCWENIPRKSIFTIPRLSGNKKDRLLEQGILTIEDLPEDFPLSDNQQKYVGLIKTGKPVIDIEGIKQELLGLISPLYFLDFETYSTPIPKFNGLHPFSKLPFQYSCHVLEENGNLNHYEYLHQSKNDPRPTLIESLINDIGNQGTVVIYNVNFERNILKDLAIQFPQYSDKLLNIEVRLWDQLNIFKNHYSHPDFLNSNSIKDILPVIHPSLSYKSLNLQSGEDAGVLWLQMLNLDKGEEKDKIIHDLKEYCKLDTLAMVEIHKHLIQLIGNE